MSVVATVRRLIYSVLEFDASSRRLVAFVVLLFLRNDVL